MGVFLGGFFNAETWGLVLVSQSDGTVGRDVSDRPLLETPLDPNNQNEYDFD